MLHSGGLDGESEHTGISPGARLASRAAGGLCATSWSSSVLVAASAVALRLLAWRGDQRYGLGPLGAPIAAFPGIQAMIEHHATLYQDLQDPLALLRDGPQQPQMNCYWP